MNVVSRLFVVVAVVLAVAGSGPESHAQITVLGKMAQDIVQLRFYNQNNNAATTIQGLNNYGGSERFNNARLPLILDPKSFTGTFDGTNRFIWRTWDTNAAAYQLFEFTLNGNAPIAPNTNQVSRIGFPELFSYKTLDNTTIKTNGVAASGVLVAQGASYLKVVPGKSGVNRFPVLHTYETGGTNYLEFTDGVLTAAQ